MITPILVNQLLFANYEVDSTTECWLYKGDIDDGYGRIYIDGIHYHTHRLAAFSFLGLDLSDSKQFACHKCSNRNCFNPIHLYVGDNQSNQLDVVNDKCPRGHDLIGYNVVLHRRPNGKYFRNCRICKRNKERIWAQNKRDHLKIVGGN